VKWSIVNQCRLHKKFHAKKEAKAQSCFALSLMLYGEFTYFLLIKNPQKSGA